MSSNRVITVMRIPPSPLPQFLVLTAPLILLSAVRDRDFFIIDLSQIIRLSDVSMIGIRRQYLPSSRAPSSVNPPPYFRAILLTATSSSQKLSSLYTTHRGEQTWETTAFYPPSADSAYRHILSAPPVNDPLTQVPRSASVTRHLPQSDPRLEMN
jgi:hypothetical protein